MRSANMFLAALIFAGLTQSLSESSRPEFGGRPAGNDALTRDQQAYTGRGIRPFDTTTAFTLRAADFLHVWIPDTAQLRDPALRAAHQNDAVHASGWYAPSGWKGYNRWLVFSEYPYNNAFYERPCLRVSNDGIAWSKYPLCPDPIYAPDSFIDPATRQVGASCTDPEMFMGADRRMWLINRVGFNGNAAYGLFVSWSSGDTSGTGTHSVWSHPIIPAASPVCSVLTANTKRLSPSIWLDAAGIYHMWLVAAADSSTLEHGTFRILLYEAVRPDSGWTFVDTVRDANETSMYLGPSKGFDPSGHGIPKLIAPWHVKVISDGVNKPLVLLVADSIGANRLLLHKYRLLIGKMVDEGHAAAFRSTPLIPWMGVGQPSTGRWDFQYPYRSTGWWVEKRRQADVRAVLFHEERFGDRSRLLQAG